MSRFNFLILFLALALTLTGCKQEDPNPELKDPIYKDLQGRASEYKKAYEESKARIVVLRESLAKTEANSIERKDVQRDLAKTEKKLLNEEQLERYYRIRSERRKVMGRMEYKKAFSEGKEWPEPKEYSDYLVNIRLQGAHRNWNARVPKLQDRMPSSTAKSAKKEEAKAE